MTQNRRNSLFRYDKQTIVSNDHHVNQLREKKNNSANLMKINTTNIGNSHAIN